MRTPARLPQRLPPGCGAIFHIKGPWHSAAGRQALFLPKFVAHASDCLSAQPERILLQADIANARLVQSCGTIRCTSCSCTDSKCVCKHLGPSPCWYLQSAWP